MAWYDGAVVRFYDQVDDALLRFAVIIAKTEGKWVFCKHRERETYELPGGHREAGEDILEAARRELYESHRAHLRLLRFRTGKLRWGRGLRDALFCGDHGV